MNTCSKLACVTLILTAGPLVAQRRPDNTITVMTFRTNGDKNVGAQAADVLRDRIKDDFSPNKVSVVQTEQIIELLLASDFIDSVTRIPEPLDAPTEQDLAKHVFADAYVSGEIVDKNGQYRVEPVLILSRDVGQRQPLPVQVSDNVDDAMKSVSRSLHAAIQQMDANRKCISDFNAGKVKEALATAAGAVARYPNATITRLCEQSIYLDLFKKATTHADSLAYADSTLAVATAVLHIDSVSPLPLQASVQLYKFKDDTARWLSSVLALSAANPNDTKTQSAVVNELAQGGHFKEAVPLVKNLVDKTQGGEPEILQLAFDVYKNAQDWSDMTTVGPMLVSADPSKADSTYYMAMALAYNTLQQPARTTELLVAGNKKVQGNGTLWYLYAQALKEQGQMPAYAIAIDTAVKYDRRYAPLLLQPVQDLFAAKQFDSAYVALTQAMTKGVDVPTADTLAFAFGAQLLHDASSVKDNTLLLQQSIKFSQLANTLAPSSKAQFYVGAAAFSIMQSAANTANTSMHCEDAQLADSAYTMAQPALTAAAAAKEPQADQMLSYMAQFRPAIKSQLKKFCK